MLFFNYSNIIDPLLRDVRTFTAKFSGVKDGNKILDVCCGTGDQLFHFKNYLKNGGLPALLEKNKLKPEKSNYLISGLIAITKAKNTL